MPAVKITRQNLIPVQVRLWCKCGGEIKAIGGLWRRDEKAEWDSICHGSCAEQTKQERAYPYIEYEPAANLAVTQEQSNVEPNSVHADALPEDLSDGGFGAG